MKMEKNKDEILFIYNSNKHSDKKALGYARTVKHKALNEVDVDKEKLTPRHLAEIAKDMDIEVEGLIDKNDETYMSKIKGGDFSDDELLKLITQNFSLLKTPIAYINLEPVFIDSQYTFVKEGLEFEGIKSDSGNSFEK